MHGSNLNIGFNLASEIFKKYLPGKCQSWSRNFDFLLLDRVIMWFLWYPGVEFFFSFAAFKRDGMEFISRLQKWAKIAVSIWYPWQLQ